MPFIENQNIKLHYEIEGEGVPIIFHNGYGNSLEDWYELGYIDALKDDYQLILMDGRGFGTSSKPHDPNQYTYALRTSDTIAIMDHLGLKKAVAFGNSMGGMMVYALMNYYPERFSCFIAAGAHPYAVSNELLKMFKEWLPHGMKYVVEQIENTFAPFPKKLGERYLKNDPKAMLATYALPKEELSTALSKIDIPVLLYAGSEDPVVPLMKKAVSLLRDGELQLIPNFDHAQAYWRGDIAGKLIKEFLQRKKIFENIKSF